MKREEPPGIPFHLSPLGGKAKWIPSLGPFGVALLIIVGILTLAAPHVLWLLAYPVLIVAALWAVVNVAAFMLRKFD
jgi:hypothetical protein